MTDDITHKEESGSIYETTYSVINRGDGIRCAWCNRLLSEIGNFEEAREHLARHDERQRVVDEALGLLDETEKDDAKIDRPVDNFELGFNHGFARCISLFRDKLKTMSDRGKDL